MKVAILYSGGKDSTYALEYALSKGWKIAYLLSVKPTRTDCFLFHYATVEQTPKIAKILGLKHILVSCDIADPKKEADIVKKVVEENKVDAVVLGGTGLQVTQITSIQKALLPLRVEAFASHAGEDHEDLFQKMIESGYRILITQVATDSGSKWIGKEITKENFPELKKDAEKYGFHIGFDGGSMDTFVLDAPFFKKKIDILDAEKVMENEHCGHIKINSLRISNKVKSVL